MYSKSYIERILTNTVFGIYLNCNPITRATELFCYCELRKLRMLPWSEYSILNVRYSYISRTGDTMISHRRIDTLFSECEDSE